MFAHPSVRCCRLCGCLHALFALSLAGCSLLLTSTLGAAVVPGSFRPIPLQGGGWVTGLAVRNIQTNGYSVYYARTDVGGMYRRYSNESSWTFLSGNMTTPGTMNVQGIAIGASAYTIFQAVGSSQNAGDPGSGVWRSPDGGTNWTQVLPNLAFSGNEDLRLGGECIVVKPGTNPETVWVGSRATGLWRSTNGGGTGSWAEVAPTVFNNASYKLNFSSLFISPSRPTEIWAGGDTGLFVSTDDGSSWTRLALLGLDGSNQPNVFKVWRITRLADGTAVVALKYGTFVDKWGTTQGANYLYKVTLKTGASGAGWSDPANYAFTNITSQFMPADGRNPIASADTITGLEVLATTNPAAPTVTPDFAGQLLVQMVNSKPVVANTSVTPWTWTTIVAARAPESVSPWPAWAATDGIGPCNKITQDPYNSNKWYANQGFGVAVSTHLSGTPNSTGTQWVSFLDGIGEVVAQPPTFDANDPRRVYLPVGDHGVATLVDGGINPDGTPNSTPYAMLSGYYTWPDGHAFSFRVLQDSAGKAYVFGGLYDDSTDANTSPNGRLWTTTDQGTDWNLEQPYVVDNHAGYPIVPSRSTVTGLALGPVGSAPTSLVSGTFEDAIDTSTDMSSYVLASTGPSNLTGINQGGIYYTTNGKDGAGTRFTQAVLPGSVAFPANGMTVGAEWDSYTQFEHDSANPKIIYLAYTVQGGTSTAGAGFYSSTGDASNPTGKVWVKLTHPSQTVAGPIYGWVGNNYRLAVDTNPDSSGTVGVPRLWVAGPHVTIGLKYSNNRGVTWNIVSGFTSALDVSAREGVICVIGQRTGDTGNKIYLSQDNGSTWDEITRANYRFPTAKNVSLSPHIPGQVWVTTGGCSYSIFTPDTTIRNLLGNPSFESDLTGWGYNSNPVTTVQAGGVFGIKVARLGPAAVNGGLTRTETLPTPLPAKIKLAFWAKPSVSYGYSMGATLTLRNASGTALTSQSVSVGSSTAWKYYETPVINVSTYPTAVTADILFWKPSAPTGSSVDVDHVQIVRVPTFVPTFSQ